MPLLLGELFQACWLGGPHLCHQREDLPCGARRAQPREAPGGFGSVGPTGAAVARSMRRL